MQSSRVRTSQALEHQVCQQILVLGLQHPSAHRMRGSWRHIACHRRHLVPQAAKAWAQEPLLQSNNAQPRPHLRWAG